jgi:hypothetical protein
MTQTDVLSLDKTAPAPKPAEAKPEQSTGKVDLAVTSTLGGVDHKTFTDAQTAHVGDNSSAHLPDVSVPVALDKNVIAEHAKLVSLADSQLQTPEAKQKFKADMNQFEQRSDQQGLTPAQITDSYKQVERMLGPAPDSPIPAAQRQELASQWMTRLGDPTDTPTQGWHDTCGWTYLESRLLTNDPDKISAKMAEVITTGSVSTIDWQKVQSGDVSANAMPTKVLKLDPGSLQPDQEAQGVSPHADGRDYVDQIAQVMEDNIKWDATTLTPTGEKVEPGTMQYEQCSVIERPSDPSLDGKSADKSCESVAYTDPKTGKAVDIDDNGYGFGGAATSTDLSIVNAAITGRLEQTSLQRPSKGMKVDTNSAISVDSVAALKETLSGLKQSGGLPMGAFVYANQPGVIEDYLARHPEKTAAQVSAAGHILSITGLDSDGNVEVYNPWGIKHTMTPDQLLQAMTRA